MDKRTHDSAHDMHPATPHLADLLKHIAQTQVAFNTMYLATDDDHVHSHVTAMQQDLTLATQDTLHAIYHVQGDRDRATHPATIPAGTIDFPYSIGRDATRPAKDALRYLEQATDALHAAAHAAADMPYVQGIVLGDVALHLRSAKGHVHATANPAAPHTPTPGR